MPSFLPLSAAELSAAAESLLGCSYLNAESNQLNLCPEGLSLLARFEDRFGFAGGLRLTEFVERMHQTLLIEAEAELA